MAIEVIRKNHPAAVLITHCKNCGTEFSFTRSDTEEYTTTDYTGSKDTYRGINCPSCDRRIVLVGL